MTSGGGAWPYRLVVIGVSLGGLHALKTLLSRLPASFPWPLAIVQHRSHDSDDSLAALLQHASPLPVSEAWDKERIQPGHVYLAPADYHLLIEPGFFVLSKDEPVNYSRPSVDVLFETAADAYGSAVVGVVLTGASADGARGAARIKARHGCIVVQDPATAESAIMPEAARAAARVDAVLPLQEIAAWLAERAAANDRATTRETVR